MITEEARIRVLALVRQRYAELCIEQRHRGLTHAEAFCVMQYQDERGGREMLWNSRDGVTPFCIGARDGEDEAQHVNFSGDVREPDHAPHVGERIFVDLSPELALEAAVRWVEAWWDDAEYPVRGMYESKDEAFKSYALGLYENGIPPHVVFVTVQLLQERGWHSRKPSALQLGREARVAWLNATRGSRHG